MHWGKNIKMHGLCVLFSPMHILGTQYILCESIKWHIFDFNFSIGIMIQIYNKKEWIKLINDIY